MFCVEQGWFGYLKIGFEMKYNKGKIVFVALNVVQVVKFSDRIRYCFFCDSSF